MEHKTKKEFSFAFFGTPAGAVEILDILHAYGYSPTLIVTNPDKQSGRNLVSTPPPVKSWALAHNIPFIQPGSLSDTAVLYKLKAKSYQLFVVVAYGTLLPKEILSIPKCGTLNIHYSLLPKYRGATPIESQILADDKDAGVSLMLVDEKMDHGPIVASEKLKTKREKHWEAPKASELRRECNEIASRLLIKIIPKWISGKLKAIPQNGRESTYTKKFTKSDGEIDLLDDPYKNYLKICAFDDSIGTYFFAEKSRKKIRVIIRDAKYENGKLILTRVVPESKKEMSYNEFLRGLK